MIIDKSNGRLAEIKAFAKEKNLLENFKETFSRFEAYTDKGYTVNLYSDFAPLSLYFEITLNEKFILNGGFIFHGPHDGFGSGIAPTFSVCIDPDNKPGWSIHT
jgi:hypothetical protein